MRLGGVGVCATSGGSAKAGKGVVEDAVTLASGELRQGAELPETPTPKVPQATPSASVPLGQSAEYEIGPGDVLSFRSLDDESLSGPVVVRYDGCISLPLIPDVNVTGATREEATELVREAYRDEFNDPRVSLSITESRSKTYHVMGDVNTPQEFPYDRPITLLKAINRAGGLRVNQQGGDSYVGAQGQLTKAVIIRHTGDERTVEEYDLRGLQEPGPPRLGYPCASG